MVLPPHALCSPLAIEGGIRVYSEGVIIRSMIIWLHHMKVTIAD
jgi:hypothetical protein